MKDNKSMEELEQEDFDTTAGASGFRTEASGINAFVQNNGKKIIIISIAVIIVVGLVLLFRMNSQKNEANAAKALSRIENLYLQGQYNDALYGNDNIPFVRGEKVIGLIAIVSEYGSTSAGQRAALYAADALFMLGKYPESKTYYEKSINSRVEEIKIGGLAGTAACNEKDGKIKDAAEGYIKAADLISDDGLKLRYMYFGGICYEKAGDADNAKKIYRDIINLNKYGEFNNLAKAGIVRLGDVID
ncbi:MAG: hypothetical protein LBO69_01105 [Ignavibacteria bacterium]|jgi:tetratricopeptide (TPR) repeat protein|nr:hypothetical protein [Ignavibacteria bacterium]